MVQTDVLKIVIAESHFSGKEPPDKIAQDLGIATDLVKDTFGRMLQEVGVSAANQFGREFRGPEPGCRENERRGPADDRSTVVAPAAALRHRPDPETSPPPCPEFRFPVPRLDNPFSQTILKNTGVVLPADRIVMTPLKRRTARWNRTTHGTKTGWREERRAYREGCS
jgi:hypothetical protein